MMATPKMHGEPQQGEQARCRRRPGGAGDAEPGQAEPAADQRRGYGKTDGCRDCQRQQWRHGVADTAQHRRQQNEAKGQRHGDHHDARIGAGLLENVGRRGERGQERPAEQAAEHGDRCRAEQRDRQRRSGDGPHLAGFARTPGLADQDGSARAQPHDEGDKKEHHREKHRDGRERIDPDHLAEVHVVDGAEQRLQNIAQHHWREENQKRLPEGRVRHGVSLLVGVTARGHATLRYRK